MAGSLEDDFSDLLELGIDLSEGDSLTTKFNKAAKHLQSIAGGLSNETLLEMYGYYKQGLEGSCNVSRPSWYDVKGKAKWEAWNKLGNLSKNDAKNLYIEAVTKLDDTLNFDDETSSESWVKVSSFYKNNVRETDKNATDYIREQNIDKVEDFLKKKSKKVNELDSDGMGMIHYAADIGSKDILKLLIQYGADVNLKDEEGQTALHYAASCGHSDCINLLVKDGADKNAEDADGNTAQMVASEEHVKELLR